MPGFEPPARLPPRADPARQEYLARRRLGEGCSRRILRRSRQSRGRAASHAAPSPSRMAPARSLAPRPPLYRRRPPRPPPRGGASPRRAQTRLHPVFGPGPECCPAKAASLVPSRPACPIGPPTPRRLQGRQPLGCYRAVSAPVKLASGLFISPLYSALHFTKQTFLSVVSSALLNIVKKASLYCYAHPIE